MARSRSGRSLTGVLLLNKPEGVSSNHALQQIKRLYKARKAGHTGTLDPMATGLLPVCFGEATKLSSFLLDADKEYLATARFGSCTDTGDALGRTTMRYPGHFNLKRAELEAALSVFLGPQQQVPPMYSALKQDGQRLYQLARDGVTVERQARNIVVSALRLEEFGVAGEVDQAVLHVRCSKGTYIRTLVEDIGKHLGVGAHLIALHRTSVGGFAAQRMYAMSELESLAGDHTALDRLLMPADIVLRHLPPVVLSPDQAARFGHGQQCALLPDAPVGRARVYRHGHEKLLGIGDIDASGVLAPKRLLLAD